MHIKITTSGGRRYVQLVESYRDETGKVKKRTVATLGRVEQLVDGVHSVINGLLKLSGREALAAPAPSPKVSFESARALGDVWTLTELWKSLGFTELKRVFNRTRHTIDVEALIRVMVFNRLCDPDSKPELSAQEVVTRYKSLADIERGFKVLKSELEIGPVHHRLPDRIRAHAAICFMALILHRVMRQRLKATHTGLSPERALESLRRIQHHQIRLNASEPITGVSTLNAEQTEVLNALAVKKPTAPQQLTLM